MEFKSSPFEFLSNNAYPGTTENFSAIGGSDLATLISFAGISPSTASPEATTAIIAIDVLGI
jgi:hypothetical protein